MSWLHKTYVPRELSADDLDDMVYRFEYQGASLSRDEIDRLFRHIACTSPSELEALRDEVKAYAFEVDDTQKMLDDCRASMLATEETAQHYRNETTRLETIVKRLQNEIVEQDEEVGRLTAILTHHHIGY